MKALSIFVAVLLSGGVVLSADSELEDARMQLDMMLGGAAERLAGGDSLELSRLRFSSLRRFCGTGNQQDGYQCFVFSQGLERGVSTLGRYESVVVSDSGAKITVGVAQLFTALAVRLGNNYNDAVFLSASVYGPGVAIERVDGILDSYASAQSRPSVEWYVDKLTKDALSQALAGNTKATKWLELYAYNPTAFSKELRAQTWYVPLAYRLGIPLKKLDCDEEWVPECKSR